VIPANLEQRSAIMAKPFKTLTDKMSPEAQERAQTRTRAMLLEAKCDACGNAEMVTGRERYPYKDCGLPVVTLLGIEVSRCPSCGEQEVAIPRIEDLHRTIARLLIGKPSRLTPEEVRFLRKYLGLSIDDFAKAMHVDASTVSQWERGDQTIGEGFDVLLRAQVLLRKAVDYCPVDDLSDVAKDEPSPLCVALKPATIGWRPDWRGMIEFELAGHPRDPSLPPAPYVDDDGWTEWLHEQANMSPAERAADNALKKT
jgi:putative zinc finger/helix-turn-helix YgiT family protein